LLFVLASAICKHVSIKDSPCAHQIIPEVYTHSFNSTYDNIITKRSEEINNIYIQAFTSIVISYIHVLKLNVSRKVLLILQNK
jgi:hypothetical protein